MKICAKILFKVHKVQKTQHFLQTRIHLLDHRFKSIKSLKWFRLYSKTLWQDQHQEINILKRVKQNKTKRMIVHKNKFSFKMIIFNKASNFKMFYKKLWKMEINILTKIIKNKKILWLNLNECWRHIWIKPMVVISK